MPDRNATEPHVEILAREPLYRGFYTLERLSVRQQRFDGRWMAPMTREVFIPPGEAIAVLPYDPRSDRVVLIEQIRVPAVVAGSPAVQIEIVAGMVEPGETLEEVARRELMEEAGLEPRSLEPIFNTLPNPGANSARIHIWLGLVDASEAGGHFGLAEEHEDIRVLPLAAEAAFDLVARGKVENGSTLIALLWLQLHRAALRERAGLPAARSAG